LDLSASGYGQMTGEHGSEHSDFIKYLEFDYLGILSASEEGLCSMKLSIDVSREVHTQCCS
jgi:hypothetical protein